MTNKLYVNYLEAKLSRPDFISPMEMDGVSVLDKYPDIGDFALVSISVKSFFIYSYTVKVLNGKKCFTISRMTDYKHEPKSILEDTDESFIDKINNAYFRNPSTGEITLDASYEKDIPKIGKINDALNAALQGVSEIKGIPVFLKEKDKKEGDGDSGVGYAQNNALMYHLQRVSGHVVRKVQKSERANIIGRLYIPDELMSSKVNIRPNDLAVGNLLSKSPKVQVYVPLDDNTLDSVFYENTTWRQIIGSEIPDCEMSGVQIKIVKLCFIIDGYQNVFCVSEGLDKVQTKTLLHNHFEVQLENENAALTNEQFVFQKPHEKVKLNAVSCKNKDEEDSEISKYYMVNGHILGVDENNLETCAPMEKLKEGERDDKNTYVNLFIKYFSGATKLLVRETYIYEDFQRVNLYNFLTETALYCKSLKVIFLEIKDPIETAKKDKEEKKLKRQAIVKMLNETGDYLKNTAKIDLKWCFVKGLHKRKMILDNGIKIDNDKGLDLFYPKDLLHCKNSNKQIGLGCRCRKVEISYYREKTHHK